MEIAHELAADGAPEGTLVWAARQEQGRGRLGRVWASPEGGLYCSLILRPMRAPAEIPQLSLVAGLSTAEAIHEVTQLHPAIRWPNDLLLGGKKVAGILAEGQSHSLRPAVVIGIGINVSTDPRELPETATSLHAAGAACDDQKGNEIVARAGPNNQRTCDPHDPYPALPTGSLSHVPDLIDGNGDDNPRKKRDGQVEQEKTC